VIKGLGLSTLAAITGEGSIVFDESEYSLTIPKDWIFRLAPELASDIPVETDCSIISKVKPHFKVGLSDLTLNLSLNTLKRVMYLHLVSFGLN